MRNFFTKGLAAAMLALLLVANPVLAAGLNGNFELGNDPGTFATLTAVNNTDISDWSVDSGSVDYIGTYWNGSNGQRSVDLNGLAPASISQTFATTLGATYNVSFDLSGNPDSRSDVNDPYYSPSAKVVKVSATGASDTFYTFDTATELNSLGAMGWLPKSYSFVATGNSTTLSFASQIPGAFGPVIDNVVITEQAPLCNAQAAGSVVSDTTTTNTTDAAPAVLAWMHPAWDAVISGASWIWATNPTVTVSNTDVTKVFTKTFPIVGTPTSGTLQIAADNNYSVKVNGNAVPVTFDQNNFQSGTQDSYNVGAFLVSGSNTLEVTVTNWGVGQSTNPEENPAGLLYKLSYTNNECVTPQPTTGTITVTKVVSGGSLAVGDFPLFVGETQVTSEQSNSFIAGTYSVHETGNANYTPAFSGDCVLTQGSVNRLNLISDWQAKKLALQMAILNNPGDAGNAAKEALIVDANVKIEALQNSLEATIDLSAGENAQCTITNTFVPPPTVTSCPADTHPVLVETKTVNSSSLTQTLSTASLTSAAPYLLVASGTWINLPYNEADAEFTSTDAWVNYADGYNISPYFLGEGEFDLKVDNTFVNWGSYNTAHIYTIPYIGTGAPVGFMMFDGDSTVANPVPEAGWYGDNSGSLSVDVIKCVSNFGSLKIVKNTIGGDGTFTFTGVGNGASVTTVDGSGDATIANLTPGTYTATETAQSGWNLTSSTCANVSVVAGETATCTVTNTKQSSISGQKYNDLNRNGKKDVGEPGLQGWTIRLKNAAGVVVATTVTDANGNYTFSNVADGTYKVREKNQKGWKRMSKNPKAIVITAGSVIADVDFGNAQKKKHEDEDTQNDCDRDDQQGEYHANGGKSNYQKEENDDYHKSKKSNSKNKSKNNRG